MKKGIFTICSRMVLAAFFYLFLLSGCISTRNSSTSLLNLPEEFTGEIDERESAEVPNGVDDSTSKNVTECLSALRTAGDACADGRFEIADSLYQTILPTVVDGAGEESVYDDYLAEIIQIYSTVMPDSIAVPEEIALQVFQRQMLLSLDTIPFSEKDTLLVSRLLKRSAVQHDVPVVWNARVEKALLSYITRNQITVAYWKKRSCNYLPFMKRMFADSALPQDLAYLPLIESGFNPRAYSRAHAAGIWQFIPSTGKLYGLRNNYWMDERRDAVKATIAAIRYLKKLHGDFGHWHLALAAYNCGEGGLGRAIARCKTNDYWQLQLPKETMNYVPLYLAALTIAKDPEFTIDNDSMSDTIPFDTVSISDCVDMRDIAKGIAIPYDTLKALNPHILHWCTPPDMSSIRLYLPAGKAPAFSTFFTSLPDEKKVRWYRYRVRPGDNLGSIARHFKLPIEGIKSINEMNGSRIIAGKYLFIPIPLGDTRYKDLPQEEPSEKQKVASREHAVIPPNAKHVVYEVKTGDTIWRLAELFGVTGKQIQAWNNLRGNYIKVGQVLSLYTYAQQAGEDRSGELTKNAQHDDYKKYIAGKGENYYGIARMFSMSVRDLYTINNIDPDLAHLLPGDTLLVQKKAADPAVATARKVASCSTCSRYIVSLGDNLFRIAQNFSLKVADLCKVNAIAPSAILSVGDTLLIPAGAGEATGYPQEKNDRSYTVKTGDNLWRIAQSCGIPVLKLLEYNGLQANAVLMPGDTIRYYTKDDL